MNGVTNDVEVALEHLTILFGDDTEPAYVFIGEGHDPTTTDTGAVQYDRWNERPFVWPDAADAIAELVGSSTADLFVTPARSANPVRSARRKRLPSSWLWADIDTPTKRSDGIVAELVAGGAMVVDSGSAPGRRHVYVPLEEPVQPDTVERLNRRLARHLGADLAVGRHNGYLRLAGSWNRKPAARGGEAAPVVLHRPNGAVFSVADLDDMLPDAPATPSSEMGAIDLEAAPEELPPAVRSIVEEPVVPGMDRSARTMALIGACRDAGLSAGQALDLAHQHAPSEAKYGGRLEAEVARCWSKVGADGQGQPDPHDDDGDGGREDKRSQATELVELAREVYDLGVTEAGEPFAVAKAGPRVALQFRGGRSSLGAALARTYFAQHGKAPTAAARADALAVLEGMAADLDPAESALRVGRDDRDRIVVDLGTADGHSVIIGPSGWELVTESPILFRRTNLTAPLPEPADVDDEALSILRDCGVSLPDRDWRLLVGFLVASLVADIPHPILALTGEQGTGKSSLGRIIGSVLDPSSAPLRMAPRNEESWAIQAAGSWVVVLDNLSSVQPWLSDALCRAVTGDGMVRRTLYTNADVSVLSFRRVVVMTSIDAGAMRGDLAERLLPIELERIDPTRRRTERELADQFHQAHPAILGALFTLTSKVLAAIDDVVVDELPRLADFARVLAALDSVTGWATLGAFLGIGTELADDVVDADPVASAVKELVLTSGSWSGTSTQLLERIGTDERTRRKDWPKSPQAMTGALKRAATALRAVGVNVEHGDTRSTRRTWFLTRCEEYGETSSTSSTSAIPAPTQASRVDELPTPSATSSTSSTTSSTPEPCNPAALDEVDELADVQHHSSHDDVTLCPACGERPAGSFSGGPCARCSAELAEAI